VLLIPALRPDLQTGLSEIRDSPRVNEGIGCGDEMVE
jgi:hypothetical protein